MIDLAGPTKPALIAGRSGDAGGRGVGDAREPAKPGGSGAEEPDYRYLVMSVRLSG